MSLPAVRLPAQHLPGSTLPGYNLDGQHYPAQHIPAVDIPAETIPAQTIPRTCISTSDFEPAKTRIKLSGYGELDPQFSTSLTRTYWDSAGAASELPDPTAPGFGEYNAAGFPKNEYVRPYIRRDGTTVSGYWRNSPSDGLPTCQVIDC